MRLRALVPFLAVLLLAGCFGGDDPAPIAAFPTRELTVTGNGQSQKLTVELASTEPQREQGLMYRQSLDDSWGMLFLFPQEGMGGFWMKNTYVPLTIAYLAADGTVVDFKDGKPLDETVLTPSAPYRYVLEVNQGWFTRHGFGAGTKVSIPGDLPAAR